MQDVASEQRQTYNIMTCRERRQTRPPQWYAKMVAYTLLVTGSLNLQKPNALKKQLIVQRQIDGLTLRVIELNLS